MITEIPGSILPGGAAAFSLVWAYPWARWLIRAAQPAAPARDRALLLVLTPALSLGGLAWLLLMLSALSSALVSFWLVTFLLALLCAAGIALLRRQRAAHPAPPGVAGRGGHFWRKPLPLTLAVLVAVVAALTLFNAAYWPFYEDDTLTLYAPMAYRFVQTGQFSGAGLYDAYPMLDPLVMAYLQLAGGAPQEYASRFTIAVLALGVVGATYVLGRDLYRREVGLTAAFLLIAAPILPHWAASGYTDLPAGTYTLLAAIMAWRLFRRPHPVYAILTGLLAGLAAFTKNGALLTVASLGGWVLYTRWYCRWQPEGEGRPIGLRNALLLAGAALLVAGPWYGHTLHQFGLLVPPTGWIDQAQHTLAMLFGPALTLSHFMIGGPLGMAGLAGQVVALWRARPAFQPRAALLIGFSVPFWLVWWWFFSYDLRFLLLVWGLFAVMGAYLAVGAAERLPFAPPRWSTRFIVPLVLIALTLPAVRMAVDHKPEILHAPLMNNDARHRVQLGGRWDAILWLREHAPAGARVLIRDYRFAFYLMQDGLEYSLDGTTDRAEVARYDYWITAPDTVLPAWAVEETGALQTILSVDGYTLYAVAPDAAPAPGGA